MAFTNRRRELLHHTKLEEFAAWAVANGYIRHPTPERAEYEVLRLEKFSPSGNNEHLVFYRRSADSNAKRGGSGRQDGSTHITTFGKGTSLVHRWLGERKKPTVDELPVAEHKPRHEDT